MPTDQLYSLYIGWDVDRKLFHQMLPSALLLKFEGTIRPISLIFKTFSSPNFALWVMVPCGPVHKKKKNVLWPNSKAGRGTHGVCQSVCETSKWELWELSFLIVLQMWVSAPAEGDKTQTPQETNFSIKLAPSSVSGKFCLTFYDWRQTSFRQFRQRSFYRGEPCKSAIWSA